MADENPEAGKPAPDSTYFDQWYADMEPFPAKDAILQRHMGTPAWLGSAGILAWEALGEIAGELHLDEGQALVDLACGRGGYGIELSRRTGAMLVGVDFSSVALGQARGIAARLLPGGHTHFQVGTLTHSGLATGSADALMCTDSIQFAEPPLEAAREFARVLRPGGRLAITVWQATTAGDPSLPARLRHLDVARDLRAAGFQDVVLETRPTWRSAERGVWEEAVATDGDQDDLALRSLREEGHRSLETFDALQRVVAYATAP